MGWLKFGLILAIYACVAGMYLGYLRAVSSILILLMTCCTEMYILWKIVEEQRGTLRRRYELAEAHITELRLESQQLRARYADLLRLNELSTEEDEEEMDSDIDDGASGGFDVSESNFRHLILEGNDNTDLDETELGDRVQEIVPLLYADLDDSLRSFEDLENSVTDIEDMWHNSFR